MPKCKNCGKEIDKNMSYKVGKSSYYCNEGCYNIKISKRNVQKKKYEPKIGTDRRDYTDYIQSIYLDNGYDKSEIPWTLIMSQSKNIMSEHKKWTYTTLQYILYYMYEIEELNLFTEESNGSILSLLPFYGQKAEQYFNESSLIENSIEQFNIEENTKVIKSNKNINKRFKPIDLSSL